jgi:hypothetical protein
VGLSFSYQGAGAFSRDGFEVKKGGSESVGLDSPWTTGEWLADGEGRGSHPCRLRRDAQVEAAALALTTALAPFDDNPGTPEASASGSYRGLALNLTHKMISNRYFAIEDNPEPSERSVSCFYGNFIFTCG